jgi:large subunit ribosomal protein L24
LSKELRTKYKRRNFPLRKGDEVEVMMGEHKKKHGKISKVDLKEYRVYVEGITIKRTDGTERQIALHHSKLKIVNLNLEDKLRVKALERNITKK